MSGLNWRKENDAPGETCSWDTTSGEQRNAMIERMSLAIRMMGKAFLALGPHEPPTLVDCIHQLQEAAIAHRLPVYIPPIPGPIGINGWITPEDAAERLGEKPPVCPHCGKPATCYGTYEGHTGYGCDECCGHGNEDGHCEPVVTAANKEPTK
jgi:hypothetical protein